MAPFVEMRDINHMASGDSAFANQAAAQEIVQAEKMAASLDNLANASIQKNNTIDKLVATYQQQAKIIAKVTEAIAKLKAGSPPMEQGSGRANPPHWRATKFAWDPTGYCWTHGFQVKVGHSSAICSFPKEGHCMDATHANTKGGSDLGQGGPKPPT
jgi:hypothetical protein